MDIAFVAGLSFLILICGPINTSSLLYRCNSCLCNFRFERAYCTDLKLDKIPNLGQRSRINLKSLYLTGNKFDVIQPAELAIYKAEQLSVYVRRQIGIVCVWINGTLPSNIKLIADCIYEEISPNPTIFSPSTTTSPSYQSSVLPQTPPPLMTSDSTMSTESITSELSTLPSSSMATPPLITSESISDSPTTTSESAASSFPPPQIKTLLDAVDPLPSTVAEVIGNSMNPANHNLHPNCIPGSGETTPLSPTNNPLPSSHSVPVITTDNVQQEAELSTIDIQNVTLSKLFTPSADGFIESMTGYNQNFLMLNISGSVLLLLSCISISILIICKRKCNRRNRGFNHEFYSLTHVDPANSYVEPPNSYQSSESQYFPIPANNSFRSLAQNLSADSHTVNTTVNENFQQ